MYDVIGGAITVSFFAGAIIGAITAAVVVFTVMTERRSTH